MSISIPAPLGRRVSFNVNFETNTYPVNHYQSLTLASATSSELNAILVNRGLHPSSVRALEICCGGAPVAIWLKTAGVGRVSVSDVNCHALEQAKRNASANGISLDAVKEGSLLDVWLGERFEVISVNPPCRPAWGRPIEQVGQKLSHDGGYQGISILLTILDSFRPFLGEWGLFTFPLTSVMGVFEVLSRIRSFDSEISAWTSSHTPVASRYCPIDGASSLMLERRKQREIFVWDGGDGYFWRLSWIVCIAKNVPGPAASQMTHLPLVPIGMDLAHSPVDFFSACLDHGANPEDSWSSFCTPQRLF